ncbi:MAG TPA: preprotein translocase subunit SecE [Chromatiales bacterium]|nr:preprotein translocase subunit SecE [Chromatiales bacterium]
MAQKSGTTSTSPLDTVKLAIAVVILVAAVVGFYWFVDEPLIFRVPGLLAATGIAVAVGSQTVAGRTIWAFIGESRTEVRKVVWPTRHETVQTTLVVIGLVLLVAVFLWALDMGLLRMVRVLTGQGS